MDRVALAGWAVLALALVGYVIGALVPYPGRSVTLPGMMVGIALAAIGSGDGSGSAADTASDPGAGADGAGGEGA